MLGVCTIQPFIRPILEYASEVWFNCGQFNSNRLEKVQTEAARIVCGFPRYASIASIYKETGWDKLKVRREVKNLTLFYKFIIIWHLNIYQI